ncbi:MAG TPA: hypothetical protein VIU64_21085 [Polyangia bacterium]
MTVARRRFAPALLATVVAFVLGAGAVRAAPVPSGRVALLDSPGSGPLARDCVTRIRAELVAGGFEVSVVDPGPRADPITLADVMEQQQGTVATVALVGDPDQPAAELWILDRIGPAPVVRRVQAPSDDREHLPEILAIRTIEILRASALKLLVESTRAAAAPPVAVEVAPPPPPPPRPRTFGLEAGVSLLESVGGAGPAALPLARLRARLGDWMFARLTVAGLGTRPQVDSMEGSASINQSLGLVELAVALRPGRRVRPTFMLGGGAFHFESEGVGRYPSQGVRAARFTGAADAGVGLLANVTAAVSLAFEVHGLVALPHPKVRFFDTDAATLGYPALLASLTMVAWL